MAINEGGEAEYEVKGMKSKEIIMTNRILIKVKQ
jgi:hypothetical protein